MKLVEEWVRYGREEQFSGYAVRPAGVDKPLPAVIVLQEIWGVDEHIQDVTRRIAAAGYAAFAPDLFARNGERPEALSSARILAAQQFMNGLAPGVWADPEQRAKALAALPAEEGASIGESLGQIFGSVPRMPEFADQTAVTAEFLRAAYGPTRGQRIASVGFCLGGALSAGLATRDADLSGAVIFYGTPPAADRIASIACPVLGFYGELDKRITDQVPAFTAAAEKAGVSFEHHIYPGAPHAFFNDGRPSYHIDSARDAYARLLVFLQKALAG